MRATWSGSIEFGMIGVPVRLYKATETHAGPDFHQVHETDGARIRLKRFCEVEDAEVPYAEVARGIELNEDEDLIVSSEDLAKLPLPSKGRIEILAFLGEDSLDPLRYEAAYYVGLGKGAPGKPYVLLREAMRSRGKVAVAKVTLSTRESLAVLRVVDDLLVLHTMLWPDEVRARDEVDPPAGGVHANELRMAKSLMAALSEDFDVSQLRDEYRDAVEELVEAKLAGREMTQARPVPASRAADIEDVLRRSLDAEKAKHAASAAKKSTPGRRTG